MGEGQQGISQIILMAYHKIMVTPATLVLHKAIDLIHKM